MATPAGFCEGMLGYPSLYPWQVNVLQPFLAATGSRSADGAGGGDESQ